ncbi:BTB/POZ-like protein [Botryosphaeria dothidea]|uniref:BTB/POZ-like protein n=1 Tax=Botryosphaeria dothidea TaxID=55169 RepID=A0A8H4J3U9_9PEZI|nr:BTB/POZ-like protein [Botryosphaeria dothidea]
MASATDDAPVQRLKNNLINIWKSSEYSDLLIRCNNGDEHKVHRIILCSQSDFFRRACNPKTGFKVHIKYEKKRRDSRNNSPTFSSPSPQEALSGVIELQHDEPDVVRAMLEFCYTFTYSCRKADSAEDRMIFHVYMYAVGEIYDLPGLKKLAIQNFEKEVNHTFPRFPAAVRAIYETTPHSDRGLRDVILRVCAANAKELMSKPQFESMMDELGVFGKELSRTLAGRSTYVTTQTVIVDCRKYRCGVCRRAVAWNIPKPCPTELLNCMYCGAGFPPNTWKKRMIKPEDPPEPEDVIERPSSANGGDDDNAPGW